MLFSSAKEGEVIWLGDIDARVPTIHREDLGEAFRLVAEKVWFFREFRNRLN